MAKLRGIAAIVLLATLMVACSGGGLVLEVVDAGGEEPETPMGPGEEPETPVEPEEITITVELPYPQDADIYVGISGVTVTCLSGCDSRQTQETNLQGEVTLTGRVPLTIRAEKSGYISVERQVYGGRVDMGHEWPPELGEAIRQLGLASAIDSGELFLVWGDTVFVEASIRETGNEDIGALFACPTIIVKQFEDRNFMVRILAHEAMHAWQGRNSTNPPCDLHYGYPQSTEGKAWVEVWDKDVRENGPYPGIDGESWASTIWENQAEMYSYWYYGPDTKLVVEPEAWADKKKELEKLYRLAPNRSRYFEDRFGPPPPR